jgi:hypothetical protein
MVESLAERSDDGRHHFVTVLRAIVVLLPALAFAWLLWHYTHAPSAGPDVVVAPRQPVDVRDMGTEAWEISDCPAQHRCRFDLYFRREENNTGLPLQVHTFEDAEYRHAFAVVAPAGTVLRVAKAEGVVCTASSFGTHILDCDQTEPDALVRFTIP